MCHQMTQYTFTAIFLSHVFLGLTLFYVYIEALNLYVNFLSMKLCSKE